MMPGTAIHRQGQGFERRPSWYTGPWFSREKPMRVHVKRGDEPVREFTIEQVNSMLAKGELDGDELAWTAGLSAWTQLRCIPGVALPSPPPLPGTGTQGADLPVSPPESTPGMAPQGSVHPAAPPPEGDCVAAGKADTTDPETTPMVPQRQSRKSAWFGLLALIGVFGLPLAVVIMMAVPDDVPGRGKSELMYAAWTLLLLFTVLQFPLSIRFLILQRPVRNPLYAILWAALFGFLQTVSADMVGVVSASDPGYMWVMAGCVAYSYTVLRCGRRRFFAQGFAGRPALLWVISSFYFISLGLVWVFFSRVYSGAIPVNTEYLASLTWLDYGSMVVIGTLNLLGAVMLLLLRRYAFHLLSSALALSLAVTVYYIVATNRLGNVGGSGLVAMNIGLMMNMGTVLYSRALVKKGILR